MKKQNYILLLLTSLLMSVSSFGQIKTIPVTGTTLANPLIGPIEYRGASTGTALVDTFGTLYVGAGNRKELNIATIYGRTSYLITGGVQNIAVNGSNSSRTTLLPNSWNGSASGTSGTTSLAMTSTTASVVATYTAFQGLQYDQDYSANFTSYSLINKAYADATYAPIVSGGYVPYTGATSDLTLGTHDLYITNKINTNTRSLINSVGNTVFSWENGEGFSGVGLNPKVIDLANSTLNRGTVTMANWYNGSLFYQSGNTAYDWGNGKSYASNGTTLQADHSNTSYLSLRPNGGTVLIGENSSADLQVKNGSQGIGKVLTDDGTGNGIAVWATPSSTATPGGSAGGDLTGTYPNPTINASQPNLTTATNLTSIGTLTAGSVPASLITGTLAVANGGTGVNTSTGSGSVVLSGGATLTTPTLGVASSTSESITGTGGNGYLSLTTQTATPSAPSSGTRIFSNSNSKFSWLGSANNYVKTFDGGLATADRVYSLPNRNVTIDSITASTSTALNGILKGTGSLVTTISSTGTGSVVLSSGANITSSTITSTDLTSTTNSFPFGAMSTPIYSGKWRTYPSTGTGNTATGWSGTMQWVPYFIEKDHYVTDISIEVTTAATGSLTIAMYTDSLGLPRRLIEASGNLATSGTVTTGQKTYTFTGGTGTGGAYFLHGQNQVVWMGFQVSAAGVGFRYNLASQVIGTSFLTAGTGAQNGNCATQTQAYGSWPTTTTTPAIAGTGSKIMFLKVQ